MNKERFNENRFIVRRAALHVAVRLGLVLREAGRACHPGCLVGKLICLLAFVILDLLLQAGKLGIEVIIQATPERTTKSIAPLARSKAQSSLTAPVKTSFTCRCRRKFFQESTFVFTVDERESLLS
jgi:hypothetical protein